MANQLALQLLVPPGDEMLCDADAHVVTYEVGAAAAYAGISSRTWPAVGAELDPDVVVGMIRPDGYFAVPTRAIAVEQTHNRGGGGVIPLSTLTPAACGRRRARARPALRRRPDLARARGRRGAVGASTARCSTRSRSASPRGSARRSARLVVGSAEKIAAGPVLRKRMGGGMRQVGILAAAGRYALAHHVERLADDHAKAARLAEAVAPHGVLATAGADQHRRRWT